MFVSEVRGATGKPILVAISSAFVEIFVSVLQDRPPFLGDHKRGYRGHGRAAALLGQTPSRHLRRTQAAVLDQREAARYSTLPAASTPALGAQVFADSGRPPEDAGADLSEFPTFIIFSR